MKTESMVSNKRDRPECELCLGDVNIKLVQKFNYFDCVATDCWKCYTDFQKWVRIAEITFQKLSKVLNSLENVFRKKRSVLNYYAISNLLDSIECRTTFSQIQKRLEAIGMWFYQWIPQTEPVSNKLDF